MDKNKKKILSKNKVVEYNPEEETLLNIQIEPDKHVIPIKTINEDSNVIGIGYVKETGTLYIQYQCMHKSVEGIELGMRPEPFGYFYHDVHKSVYNSLMKSKNKAKFINDNIKTNYIYHRELIWTV